MKSLNTKLWEFTIWTSPAKFQTLDVWFILIRTYLLVKFGMEAEQILANMTTIFWMHSFISGHKKVEYIFRNRVSIAHVTVFITRQYPESQSYCSSLMIDSWSTVSDARQPRQGGGGSVVLPLIRRKAPRDAHKCSTIHIVYRIANPIYQNSRTIITQIKYCTDCMLLLQIPNVVRCNVVDTCNEKTVIIQFQ